MPRLVDGAQQASTALAASDSRLAAARTLRACRAELAERGATILDEVLAGQSAESWRHYPENEVYDPRSGAQFFFHAHEAADPRAEQGHFHTFLRAEGMPPGVSPLLLPEIALAGGAAGLPPQAAPLRHGARSEHSHIVAIAIDGAGEPVRLFTTNRWVTGESWYRAEDVIRMIDLFALDLPMPGGVLNRWIAATLGLFAPQIAQLLHQRDAAIMRWRRTRRGNAFEERRLEILSSVTIDLDLELDQVEHLDGGGVVPPRRVGLPRMAEGWGEF